MFTLSRPVALLFAFALCVCSGCASTASHGSFTVKPDVVYAHHDDGDLHADIYVPAGHGPFPAVVTIHGGSWRTGWRWEMASIARQLAARDMVVMNIAYRLAPAHHWPDQYNDAQDAVRFLRSNATQYHIDTAHIGAWGYSAGAQLALLLASPDAVEREPSSRVQVVVGGGSPADLRMFGENALVSRYLNGTPSELPDAYRAASPVTHVAMNSPPTFLYHGRDDWIVDIAQAREFAAALRAKGTAVELVELPRGHLSAYFFADGDTSARAIAFLNRYLRPTTTAGSGGSQ